MNKTDIRSGLERHTQSPFIKAGQLAAYVGDKNLSRVRQRYLIGLECLPGKIYLCSDVAERMAQMKGGIK